MTGLTTLGIVHTTISLIAVVSGLWALIRDRHIVPTNRVGMVYLLATLVAAATGLGIFQNGGFGPPHALSIMTLIALAVGTIAAASDAFGRASRYIQTISYSSTFFFHMIVPRRIGAPAAPVARPVAAMKQNLHVVFACSLIVGGCSVACGYWGCVGISHHLAEAVANKRLSRV
jgi:hypothetical protein